MPKSTKEITGYNERTAPSPDIKFCSASWRTGAKRSLAALRDDDLRGEYLSGAAQSKVGTQYFRGAAPLQFLSANHVIPSAARDLLAICSNIFYLYKHAPPSANRRTINPGQVFVHKRWGSNGIRDLNALKAAIQRPYSTFDGKDLYPTIYDKDAALVESLVKNHAFIDGNKRIG